MSPPPALRRLRRRDRVDGGGPGNAGSVPGRRSAAGVGALAPGDDRAVRLGRGPIEIDEGLSMYTTGAQPTPVVDRMSSARRLTDEALRAWAAAPAGWSPS